MKDKASRAMAHLDEELIDAAMGKEGGKHGQILKRRNTMKHTWKRMIAAAALFAVVLTAAFLILPLTGGGAVIALDVNPSLELEVNRKEQLTAVRALNAEAEEVLAGMKLEGVDLNVAVNAIIGSMHTLGYLSEDQNSILISVDAKKGKADELKTRITEEVGALLSGKNIEASVITQSFEKEKTGTAKEALVQKIVAAGLLDAGGVPYTAARLEGLKVHELKLILDSKKQTVSGTATAGTAATGAYLSADEAKAIAYGDAAVTEGERLQLEMDFDDERRVLVYEIEFRVGELEYEYEIHAKSGEILEKEKKPAGRDDDDDAPVTAPEGLISREEALAIAYADAGVSADEVRRPEIELDREGGRYVYEVEFKTEAREYEYELNAETGAILKRENEPRD